MMILNIFNMILSLILLLATSLVGATPTDTLTPKVFSVDNPGSAVLPEGYTLRDMVFKGKIGDINVEANGTVQDIMNRFKEVYPELAADIITAANSTSLNAANPRNEANKDAKLCCPVSGHSWGGARMFYIIGGIAYLQNFNGACGVMAHSCIRISCDQNQAIFLCNDNPYDIYPDCGYIASYAQGLVDDCWFWMGPPDTINRQKAVCGQYFDTDSYNVVVTGQWCWIDSHDGPDNRGFKSWH